MPLAKNVMRAGLSAGAARAVNGNEVQAAITAAGTTQGGAAACEGDMNNITTGTTGQGVIVSQYAMPGDSQIFYNATTADLRVYPRTGQKINQVATNGGVVLASYTALKLYLTSSTQWVGFLSA